MIHLRSEGGLAALPAGPNTRTARPGRAPRAGAGLLLGLALHLGLPVEADEQAPPRQEVLPVPGFKPAVVVRPAREGRRPVAVLLHSSADRPEWMCRLWAPAFRGRGWLLCPRGIFRADIPERDRWTLGPLSKTKEEIQAALAALEARYPGRISPGARLIAGFSKGAYQAAAIARQDPKAFPLVFAHEGGGRWSARAIKGFVKGGGRGLIIGCGKPRCARAGRRSCAAARRAGLPCQLIFITGLGHSCGAPFGERAASPLRRLLTGEKSWQ